MIGFAVFGIMIYYFSIYYRPVRLLDSMLARMASSTKEGVFLYGPEGRCLWNKGLLKMYGINPDHMPDIIDCSDLVGGLTKKAADELGLVEGIPVFGGGGDTTFVNIGAGCVSPGDTHIYVGTSGWVSTYMDHHCRYMAA